MSPLQEAAHRAVGQFSDRHQPLRMLMVNTLVAIIETEIGPLFKKHQEQEATIHVLRDFLGAELDHDHTRGEAKRIQRQAFDMVNSLTGGDALRKAWTRAETAEASVATLNANVVRLLKERDDARDAQLMATQAADSWKESAKALEAQRDKLGEDSKELRRMVAFAHTNGRLYFDDGELQDTTAHPFIDWKRDSIEEIKEKLAERLHRVINPGGVLKPCPGCERTKGWLGTQSPGTKATCPLCKLEFQNASSPTSVDRS